MTKDIEKSAEGRLQQLAIEINTIKTNTQRIMMQAAIDIGRRLAEAKYAVGHGNWGAWLKANVDYSERTAQNLIKIFDEYGAVQQTLFGKQLNPQLVADLSYTQAVALLGIKDPDERAAFVEEHDVAGMTKKELERAIRERDEAKKALSKEQRDREIVENRLEGAEKARQDLESKLTKAEDELQELRTESEKEEPTAVIAVTADERVSIEERTKFGAYLDAVKRGVEGMMDIVRGQRDEAGWQKYHDAVVAAKRQIMTYCEGEANG